jgi:hypothetical protein
MSNSTMEQFTPVELPSKYAKAIVAIATAAVGTLVVAFTDNAVTPAEVLQVALAVVTAIGVYLVPNLPGSVLKWGKLMVATVGAGLQVAVTAISETGFTPTTWLLIVLAVLGAVSVGIIPNTSVEKPAPALTI